MLYKKNVEASRSYPDWILKCAFDSETEKFKTLGGIEECMLYCNVSHQTEKTTAKQSTWVISLINPELPNNQLE